MDTGPGRIDYIDHLRIFLTALVVCHHQAIAFGAPGGWYYVVVRTDDLDILSVVVMTMFVAVNQAFFMSLFYLVAAYFTPISFDKKGTARFIRDRLKRLGIPLVVYFFLLHPTVVYMVLRFSGRVEAGYLRFMAQNALESASPGPMWFVLALLMFTAVYVAAAAWRQSRGAPRRPIDFPTNRRILIFILAVGVLTFLLRLICPVGWGILDLQIGYFPLYICMFTFGILAYRSSWLDQLRAGQANLWFCVSIALILALPFIMILGGALEGKGDNFRGGLNGLAFTYAMWEPFLCVGISMKLLVVFRARLNRTNALTRRLSQSAYTAYILHPFFVVPGTFLAMGLPLPPLAIVLIVCPLVLAACFFCSNLIRQAPLLNRVL